MERDIFGRLLAIAIKQKVNIGYCLSFPLAPIPPALFSCSGDMLETDKSTLSKQLTSQIDSENPDKVDIEIIDGFYYMYQIGNATPLEVENIILGDSQDDSADNEEDSDVCSDEVDSSDDSESSLESDYE
ncbi:hypothetical protein EVAR_86300_1 [Eumeta japonica]|uniref:Uncharacterized protein n=1 Tax=Eumeta variegata TaxID=151549 RepID=A0A4C1WG30_EUMVA|nr:hypothetical protein EVAR_81420_1 [Eumeta japonica]GBP58138.1 hypothetical protein EVAR_86300_1 [Eumeta japonica]